MSTVHTSAYVVGSTFRNDGTVYADETRSTMKALRPASRWSALGRGGIRYRNYQLSGDKPIHLDAFVRVLHAASIREAIEILRAALRDSRKAAALAVCEAGDRDALTNTALDAAVSFASFLSELDKARQGHSIERKRLFNELIGAQARMRSAAQCAGMGE